MLFISLEGGEGAGKTTQAARLVERIESTGLRCLRVREPGSTDLGAELRKLIKRSRTSDEAMSRAAELFLFAAARSELVTKVIGPQRDDPDLVVVADRYADSTVAYQGYGRGIDIETIKSINALATNALMPDLTFLLDCPPGIGISRVRGLQLQMPLDAMKDADTLNRDAEGMKFEEESEEFHQRIRQGFHDLATQEPNRWRVIDATRSIDAISDDIWNAVRDRLPVPANA
ncbi:MAG: dTMP kinase [Dehalococcoidia bacterium]|nr:dTMP kinase [Dehalococcoidia bacterium]